MGKAALRRAASIFVRHDRRQRKECRRSFQNPIVAIAFDYRFGGGSGPFESLAGHLPVPLPMP
jgi:hypothetical protein